MIVPLSVTAPGLGPVGQRTIAPAACFRSRPKCCNSKEAEAEAQPVRQWPEVSDFVARFCTLRESENTRTCENCTQNVQKSVTRIIYLGPLPTARCYAAESYSPGPWPKQQQLLLLLGLPQCDQDEGLVLRPKRAND